MTREEAIDVLSDFRKFTLSILGKSIYAERCSALDMAIEALHWKDRILTQIEDIVLKEHGERREE